jgi:hypothetical protein
VLQWGFFICNFFNIIIMVNLVIKLIFKAHIIRDHSNKLRVCGLAAIILDSVAKVGIEGINVASVPSYLNGVADGSFHTGCGGLVLFRHGRV